MAKIYSPSGCTMILMDFFNHSLEIPMYNFSEIKDFHDNFPQILHQTKKKEEKRLRQQICFNISKTQKALDLYRKMVQRRIIEIKSKGKEIIDKLTKLSSKDERSPLTLKKFAISSFLQRTLRKLRETFFQLKLWYLTTFFHRLLYYPFRCFYKAMKNSLAQTRFWRINFNLLITDKISPLQEGKRFLEENRANYFGAMGEEAVIHELRSLPDSFRVYNDITFRLPSYVYWKKGREYVGSAQLDHLVVGPTGIFIIETKFWSKKSFATISRSPHHQVSRAGFLFFLIIQRYFPFHINANTLLCCANYKPNQRVKFVRECRPKDLYQIITHGQVKLNQVDISALHRMFARQKICSYHKVTPLFQESQPKNPPSRIVIKTPSPLPSNLATTLCNILQKPHSLQELCTTLTYEADQDIRYLKLTLKKLVKQNRIRFDETLCKWEKKLRYC